METQKFKEKCVKHQEYKIEYIRIKNQSKLSQQQQSPLFICQYCPIKDSTINLNDYLSIKCILKQGLKEIIPSWPPINNPELMNNLINLIDIESTQHENIQKIIAFFTNLKQTINDQINICQKNMIKLVEDSIPPKNEDILQKYQEISKINVLTSHLLNNETNISEKQKVIEELVESFNNSTQTTCQNLKQLMPNKFQKLIYNSESASVIEQQILQSLKNIQLFQNIPIHYERQPERINLNLQQSNFNIQYNKLQITLNNEQQYEISLLEQSGNIFTSFSNVFSNIVFDKNKKYIIRVKIDNLKSGTCLYLGLMQQSNIHINEGLIDKLSFKLIQQGQILSFGLQNSSFQKIQGDRLNLSNENTVELRISIKDQILHLLDYPSYQYKVGIQDQSIQNLINAQNLVFQIGFAFSNLNTKVTLTDAFIVESFD